MFIGTGDQRGKGPTDFGATMWAEQPVFKHWLLSKDILSYPHLECQGPLNGIHVKFPHNCLASLVSLVSAPWTVITICLYTLTGLNTPGDTHYLVNMTLPVSVRGLRQIFLNYVLLMQKVWTIHEFLFSLLIYLLIFQKHSIEYWRYRARAVSLTSLEVQTWKWYPDAALQPCLDAQSHNSASQVVNDQSGFHEDVVWIILEVETCDSIKPNQNFLASKKFY